MPTSSRQACARRCRRYPSEVGPQSSTGSLPQPRRGEVYWVSFPEPVGRRPVLVVQNDVGNRHSTRTIVAHVSATPRPDYPFLVALEAEELGRPSWVHCETLNTLPVTVLEDRLGVLTPESLARVDEALRVSLGL
jgi:mRNA interferase MazF